LSLLHNWSILIKENHDIFIKELYFLHIYLLFSCSRTIIIIHFVELILHDLFAKRRDIIQKRVNDVSNSYQKRNDRKKYIYISIFQYRIIIFLNHRSWDSFERLDIHYFNEFHFDNLIFNVSTTHIYYSSIITSSYNCSYCDWTNKINRELKRYLMTCEIRLNMKRRKIFKKIITISKNINVDDARDYFMIDDIQNQN
jgi:hypothetical protein